jgi:hypothetical protein
MNNPEELPSFLILAVIAAPIILITLLFCLHRSVHSKATSVRTQTCVSAGGEPVGVCKIQGPLTDANLDMVLLHIKRGMIGHENLIFDFSEVDYIDEPEDTLLWLKQFAPSQNIVLVESVEIRVLFELLNLHSNFSTERSLEKALLHFDN